MWECCGEVYTLIYQVSCVCRFVLMILTVMYIHEQLLSIFPLFFDVILYCLATNYSSFEFCLTIIYILVPNIVSVFPSLSYMNMHIPIGRLL